MSADRIVYWAFVVDTRFDHLSIDQVASIFNNLNSKRIAVEPGRRLCIGQRRIARIALTNDYTLAAKRVRHETVTMLFDDAFND